MNHRSKIAVYKRKLTNMKRNHKYKVGDKVWCGNIRVTILRRLDNKQYQVQFSKWDSDYELAVVNESELSLVPNERR